MNLYGQIDLTLLGELVRQHEDLARKVTFRDSSEHLMLDISIFTLQKPDRFGNTLTIKARCKKDEQIQGLTYYVGKLKDGEQGKQAQPEQPEQPEDDGQPSYHPPVNPKDLPF